MVTGTRPAPRVLVADDDDLVRLVLRRALERTQATVIEASSGSSTEETADQVFDLAIVDAHMPGSTLTQCLTALRRTNPDLPLLVISGDAQAPEGPDLPDFTFLSKPVNLDLFLATVATLLERR
jgi:DNA-binding NtrC family response regulator